MVIAHDKNLQVEASAPLPLAMVLACRPDSDGHWHCQWQLRALLLIQRDSSSLMLQRLAIIHEYPSHPAVQVASVKDTSSDSESCTQAAIDRAALQSP